MQIAKPKSTLIIFMAEQTTTPLGFACLAGCIEYVEFLLQARAESWMAKLWDSMMNLMRRFAKQILKMIWGVRVFRY